MLQFLLTLTLLFLLNLHCYSQSLQPSVIYITRDTGQSWSPFSNGIPDNATVSCFETDKNHIYAATDFHGVFVSENGTDHWKQINDGLPADIDINAIVSIEDRLVIGTFRQGIFTSDANLINWQQADGNILNTPVRAFIKSGSSLLAGSDNGIYISADKGETWKNVLPDIQILGFTTYSGNIYAGVMNGAMMSQDNGLTWQYIYQPDALHDISNDGEFVYVMTLGSGLLRSNNNGQTWEFANNGMGTLNLYTFELEAIGQDLFAAQWYGIYHSSNNGDHWTLLEGLPDSTAFSTLKVTDYGLLAGIAIRK